MVSRSACRYVLRSLSFAAALYILYCEICASLANRALIVGVLTPPERSITYRSTNILAFLQALLAAPSPILSLFEPTRRSSPQVLYLNLNVTTQNVSVGTEGCRDATPIDYLYNITYLDPLLRHSLVGAGWNLAQAWIIVDCSFDGRSEVDTSVVKVHLLDINLTQFATYFVTALTIHRPAIHRRMPGGAAFLTTAALSSMHLDPDQHVVCTDNATYFASLGFSFPYDWADFEPVVLSSLVPTTGTWTATLVSTNETVMWAGTTGLYRKSPEVQALYNYFYWALPSNPLQFAAAVEYIDVSFFKDTWGWFRCFIGLGIWFNLLLNALVAMLAMARMWLHSGVLWMPDIYPSIQYRAKVRVWLVLGACVIDNWWYPLQYSVYQANYRTGYGGATGFSEIPRADNLMLCLACAVTVASWLRVRIQLWAVVAAYIACYTYRLEIVNHCGVYLVDVHAFVVRNYLDSIAPTGTEAMDLWAYHEYDENREAMVRIIVTEYTWLIIAIGASVLYAVGVWTTTRRRGANYQSVRPLSIVPSPSTAKPLWTTWSTLYNRPPRDDCDTTRFERSVGQVTSDIAGFVAPTLEYVESHDQTRLVSPDAVWLLGYVIVDDCLVVAINDYMYVLVNAVLQAPVFLVYGYPLSGDTVETNLHRIFPHEVQLARLWRVSVKGLR